MLYALNSLNMTKGSTDAHTRLVNDCVVRVSQTGLAVVWKNATGAAIPIAALNKLAKEKHFFTMNEAKSKLISFGLEGTPDVIGFLKHSGFFIGMEMKTGNARMNKSQVNFKKVLELNSGYHSVIRSTAEALDFVKESHEHALSRLN